MDNLKKMLEQLDNAQPPEPRFRTKWWRFEPKFKPLPPPEDSEERAADEAIREFTSGCVIPAQFLLSDPDLPR